MRKLIIWLLLIFVWLSGFMSAKVFAYTNADVQKALYESERSMVAGDKAYDSSMRVHFTVPRTQCVDGKYTYPNGKLSDLDCDTHEPTPIPTPTKGVLVKPSKYEQCMNKAAENPNAWHREILMEKCDEDRSGMNWDDVARG